MHSSGDKFSTFFSRDYKGCGLAPPQGAITEASIDTLSHIESAGTAASTGTIGVRLRAWQREALSD